MNVTFKTTYNNSTEHETCFFKIIDNNNKLVCIF